uniref:Aromatic aminotransferase n=1 Tax=Ephedra sinica TaxID=33152 RepID=M9YT92_EPHSI|nr:aromatic aminotransferase [Ephedra sinica]
MASNGEWSNDNTSLRGVVGTLMRQAHIAEAQGKTIISLGQGDPSTYSCFAAPKNAQDALVKCTLSSLYNGYAPSLGLPQAKKAVADFLSKDLASKLSPNDVYMTVGCSQAIQICLTVLSSKSPNANILLPKPGFTLYQSLAAEIGIEAIFYELIPEDEWKVNLDQVRQLADENTTAIVVINPNNPCGSVFSREHATEIAQTARDLGISIVSDEIYAHIVYGDYEFVPMAKFASIVPVITLGGLSKRWLIPGWRIGWLAICDPNGFLKPKKVQQAIEVLMNITPTPSTMIQAAVPSVLQDTCQEFHEQTLQLLKTAANICYERIQKIDALSCYSRPNGSMFIMAKLNLHLLKGIKDDMDFAWHLMNEEAVLVVPGFILGMKDWIRISFAAPSTLLEEAWDRIESFCCRSSYL